MIDPDVFANEMGLLAGACRYEPDTPVLQAYYAALSPHLATDEFRAAVRAVMLTERYWPTPYVLLEKAGRDAESLSQLAFRAVTDALATHGHRYLPVEISQSWDAATWAAIRAVGGTREIGDCSEQRWPGLVKKFCKAYQAALAPGYALITEGRDRPQKQVRQLVERVGRDMALPPRDRE